VARCGPHSQLLFCTVLQLSFLQVRDRAMLHLTQLQGGAGGAEAISPDLDINLAAFEASLRNYLDADDTQQPFDVVSQAS